MDYSLCPSPLRGKYLILLLHVTVQFQPPAQAADAHHRCCYLVECNSDLQLNVSFLCVHLNSSMGPKMLNWGIIYARAKNCPDLGSQKPILWGGIGFSFLERRGFLYRSVYQFNMQVNDMGSLGPCKTSLPLHTIYIGRDGLDGQSALESAT